MGFARFFFRFFFRAGLRRALSSESDDDPADEPADGAAEWRGAARILRFAGGAAGAAEFGTHHRSNLNNQKTFIIVVSDKRETLGQNFGATT